MIVSRTYAVDFEPSLAGLKANLRLAGSGFDADLAVKLKAAIEAAELFIGTVIARSTFQESFPFCRRIQLREPVLTVTKVVVGETELTADQYTITGGLLHIHDDVEEASPVVVTYNAGLPTVAMDITQAIYLHASALFVNPVDSVEALPKASQNLLMSHRHWSLRHA